MITNKDFILCVCMSMYVYVCSYFIIEPDFVSSIEDEEYVYFFFRESAVEHINCGKVTKSSIIKSGCICSRFNAKEIVKKREPYY